jgi:hypothetical protein
MSCTGARLFFLTAPGPSLSQFRLAWSIRGKDTIAELSLVGCCHCFNNIMGVVVMRTYGALLLLVPKFQQTGVLFSSKTCDIFRTQLQLRGWTSARLPCPWCYYSRDFSECRVSAQERDSQVHPLGLTTKFFNTVLSLPPSPCCPHPPQRRHRAFPYRFLSS